MNTQQQSSQPTTDSKLENFAKRNSAKKRFGLLILVPIVLSVIIIFVFVSFAFFFKVKTVEVKGAQKYSADLLIIKSGIIAGENLYSYSESEIEEKLTLNYPYISGVKLKRRWPDKIILEVTEDTPAYATSVYGETLILSQSLRILENPSIGVESTELCELILPDVDRALVGNRPVFSGDGEFIQKVLDATVKSEFANDITVIDLRSKFSIDILIGNMYKIKCGDADELDLKLDMAARILDSGKIPSKTKAVLDVSNPAECTAVLGESAIISIER